MFGPKNTSVQEENYKVVNTYHSPLGAFCQCSLSFCRIYPYRTDTCQRGWRSCRCYIWCGSVALVTLEEQKHGSKQQLYMCIYTSHFISHSW